MKIHLHPRAVSTFKKHPLAQFLEKKLLNDDFGTISNLIPVEVRTPSISSESMILPFSFTRAGAYIRISRLLWWWGCLWLWEPCWMDSADVKADWGALSSVNQIFANIAFGKGLGLGSIYQPPLRPEKFCLTLSLTSVWNIYILVLSC